MKLLSYTSIRYLLFAALLLLISVPVFYVVLDKIFIAAIDKDLSGRSTEVPAQINAIRSERDLDLWKVLDNDLKIIDADSVTFHKEPFTEKKPGGDFRILQKKTDILGKHYVIQIESSMIEKQDLVKTILFIQFGLFFSLLLGAVAINYFINKNVWKPFYDSLIFLQQFNIENEMPESPRASKIQEFWQLNQSIHQLAASVRRRYLSQKEFIENASHELQTPLTILKFKLELLLQEKGLSKNQSVLISDMYRVIEQLDELNKNLLLLSKIENGQFTSTERVNVIATVNEVIDDLSFIAGSKSQSINKEIMTNEIELYSNKMLLKILLRNLILNALQYSEINSTICILINDTSLQVINPGISMNIKAEDLFSRFNKNGFSKGNGLGLSIVKTISDLYGFDISYNYMNDNHYFTIRWD